MPKSCVRPPHRLSSLIARGPLSTALAVVAALLLTPLVSPTARLVAQSCPFNHQCFANAPPTIAIYPHTATVSAASYPLIIYMTDDWKLDLTQFYFYKKGVAQSVTVTSTQPTAASGAVTIMLDSGVNMLVAQVKDDKGLLAVDTAYLTYIPPPPRWQPTLQLTAHHNEFRPSAPCPSCTATVAYSTPSYVTLDAPRSLTLAYSSATASPIGLVQIDATITSGTQPQWVSLKLRKPSGAYVTFANGTQEVFYQPDPGWTTRLAAQFDASDSADWPTGAYNLTAVVWASYSGTTYFDEANVRVLIVNERKSPIGAGVSWLGVPRLTENSAPNDAGVTLTVGDGSAVFYKQSSCYQDSCNYYLPAGIFSILQSSSTQYVLQGRDGSTIAFRKSATNANTSGLPLYVKDRFGNQTSFTWDTTVTPARLTTVTDPAGQTITVQYSSTAPRGGTVSITEHALGRTSTVTYNADSTLYSVQNPSPQSRKPLIAQYDAKHRLLSYTDDMLQATRSFTYDSSGWVRTVATTPSGGSAITTRIKSLPDTLLPRPGRGMYSSTADPGLSPDKAVTVIAGPASDSTRGSFDRFGLPLRVDVRDPAGRVQSTAWTRNTVGQVTSVRDPQYLITSYHYVSSTPLVDTVSQDGSKTVIQYGQFDQVTLVTINGTTAAQHWYSGSLATLDSSRQGGATTAFQWDSRGRLYWVKDAAGVVTQKTFNPTGTLNTATAIAPLPFGGTGTTSFNYDAAGRVGSVVNPVGQRDSVQYDVLNRPTWTRSRDSAVTTQSYGDAARIDTVVDALTQRYIAIRDRLGRDSVHVDPRGNSERWFYDTLGNVSQYTNRRGQSVFFTYDPLGRVKRRIAGTDTANFDYDPSSNAAGGPANGWVAARNAFALDTTWLDDHGRPATSVTRRSGHRLALWYAFDQLTAGRKTVMWSDTTGAGATIYNNFDGSFRLSAIIPWSGDSSSFSYSAASQLQRITLPTSSSSAAWLKDTLKYTATQQLSISSYSVPAVQAAAWRSYAYDSLQRTSSMVYPSGTARVPTYYTSGRLAGYQDAVRWTDSTLVCPDIDITSCYWQVSSGTTVQHAGSYSYDKVGNRTDTASVGAANQLSTFHGFTMTYDADGNMTSKSGPGLTQTLHWTVLGQLDTVTTSGSVTTFAYDAMGRRIRKTGPGGTINYLLDGGVLIAELDNSWLPIREYSYYPGTDRPHSVRKAGQVYYYLYEEPGHVIGLVNTSNQLVNQYTYEPFGAALTTSESVAQPFRFTARELDAETGLYYYRARYYDPQLARFVSEDPAGLAGGINRYTYVEGDPVNYTDPSGMQKCAWVPGAWWSSYLNGTTVNTWVDPYWLCDEDTSGYGPQLSDRGGEQQIGPIVGGGSSTALKVPLPKPTKKACAGNFHLLQGNSATINNPKMPGGFSGTSVVLVSPNSAAIIQSQWNSDRAALRRYRNEVSGDFPGAGASFQGLSDFIGGGQAHRPSGCAAGKPVSQCLMEKYPNQIFVELPSAPNAFLVTPFAGTVMVPDYAPCPHP